MDHSLSLPDIPLTYEEIYTEIKPIEDDFYNQKLEYLKDLKIRIHKQFVEKFEGIKEDNIISMNMIKLMILKQWILSRINIFREFVESRKIFLSQNIKIYPLKQKIIFLEVEFLDFLINDFQKRLENVEKLLQKCYQQSDKKSIK